MSSDFSLLFVIIKKNNTKNNNKIQLNKYFIS